MSGRKVTKRKRQSSNSAQLGSLAAAKIAMQTKVEELESQNYRLKAENTALQARVAAQEIDIVSFKGTHIVHIFI